ncbi:MAG: hypothetical protein ACK4ZJ_17265, partial [Allorhizobium sp.]
MMRLRLRLQQICSVVLCKSARRTVPMRFLRLYRTLTWLSGTWTRLYTVANALLLLIRGMDMPVAVLALRGYCVAFGLLAMLVEREWTRLLSGMVRGADGQLA